MKEKIIKFCIKNFYSENTRHLVLLFTFAYVVIYGVIPHGKILSKVLFPIILTLFTIGTFFHILFKEKEKKQ